MTECTYCGDALISFADEYDTLRGSVTLYIDLCPTCYLYIKVNGTIVSRSRIESLLKYQYLSNDARA